MKKLLLIGVLSAVSSNTLAQSLETGSPYIKAHIGLTKAQNTIDIIVNHYRSNPTMVGTIALGYNIRDNLRADLGLDYYPNSRFSTSNNNFKIDAKLRISSLLANFYMDVAKLKGYKIFVGAGAGVSHFNVKVQGIDLSNNDPLSSQYTQSNEFIYGLYAGTHYEYAPGIHAELMYSYKDLGTVNDSKLKVHNITTGIRFDL